MHFIKINKWINAIRKKKSFYTRPSDVLYHNKDAISRTEIELISDFYPIRELDFEENQKFISDLNLIHLNHLSFDNCIQLLKKIKELYHVPPYDERFKRFYNFLLSELYETYSANNSLVTIFDSKIVNLELLGVKKDSFVWQPCKNLLYIDDNRLYEKLPENIKSILPAEFSKKSITDFGTIAKKLGQVLSEVIEITLLNKIGTSEMLIDKISNIQILLLLIEKRIREKLSKNQIEHIRNICLSQQENIVIKVKYKDSSTELKEKYFIDTENNVIVIADKAFYQIFSRALKEYLSEYLGKNLEDFEFRIMEFLRLSDSRVALRNFLLDNDLDSDRLEELLPLNETVSLKNSVSNIPLKRYKKSDDNIDTEYEETEEFEIEFNSNDVFEKIDFEEIEIESTAAIINSIQPTQLNNYYTTRLNPDSAKKIGILAEKIFFSILKNKPQEIGRQIGLPENIISEKITWFNEIEQGKSISEFEDKSKGMGCDFIWHTSNGTFFIEVKGKTNSSIESYLSYNELKKMKEVGEFSILAVVDKISINQDNLPIIKLIRNPFEKLIKMDGKLFIKRIVFM